MPPATTVTLFCTQMTMTNSVSSVGDTLAIGLRIDGNTPESGSIIDIGFLDTELLLVLWQVHDADGSHGPTLLLRIPYASTSITQKQPATSFALPYAPYTPSSKNTSSIQIHDLPLQALQQALPHLQPLIMPPPTTTTTATTEPGAPEPPAVSFVPARMEVLPAADARGHLPPRVCLLGEDGVSYNVFALPEPENRGGGARGEVVRAHVDDEDASMLSV